MSPDEAYRFAQGEEVEVSGVKFKIDQPLDWAAVTDHAEYIGEMFSTLNDGVLGSDNPQISRNCAASPPMRNAKNGSWNT